MNKTLTWGKAAAVRAIKTAAQTAVALIGTNAIGFTDVDWLAVGSAALLAAALSVLTSIAGLPEVDEAEELEEEPYQIIDGGDTDEYFESVYDDTDEQ